MKGKYIYCVTKNFTQNRLNTPGVENAEVHTVSEQGLTCVVSDSECADKELSKESAIAHEKVLEEVMQHASIVPIAFGHVAKSTDEIKNKLLDANRAKLEEWLNHLQGKIELSVKAFWFDLNPVLRNIADTSVEIKKIKARGTLSRNDQMRAGEIASKLLGRKRENMENSIVEHVNDVSLDHKKCNLFGEQMITNLAFLVNANMLSTFDTKVNEYAETLGDNTKLKYTGPVPPYNFVDLKINFHS
jgi:hypothetical protein